ncbi:MAG: RdgB/HAM1 family non-canonical purine NTP pyrophosphatase [Phycisphaerales bacterium]
MPELVLATQNPGKIAELQDLLAPLGWTVLGLTDVFPPGNLPEEPEETGSTFVQNATIKARAYAAHTGKLCLADDSGLIVDALNGAPGVISSHYAFEGQAEGPAAQLTRQQRDKANTTKLLADLETVPLEHRAARFTCTMVLADPTKTLHTTSGTFEGRIGLPTDVPRGDAGFGYDPVFLVPDDYTRTSAELTKDEKNALSHRGHAVRAMIDYLRTIA